MSDVDQLAGYAAGRLSSRRSPDHVRPLPLVLADAAVPQVPTAVDVVLEDDPIWVLVQRARAQGFGGVILSGPPGTSKSWYAEKIALKLTDGDDARIRRVQFHASYQYEDFVEGMIPDGSGSFMPAAKHLLLVCQQATTSAGLHVLLIDELSRADPARVFGEALTYIEQSKRYKPFFIASGREVVIPANVFVVATMNEWDRGVDDVDAAFDRRLAKIAMEPSEAILVRFLQDAEMPEPLAERVRRFFNYLRNLPEQAAHLGHTYFIGLKTELDLEVRWQLQLSHVLRKAFRLDDQGYREVQRAWREVVSPPTAVPGVAEGEVPEAPADA